MQETRAISVTIRICICHSNTQRRPKAKGSLMKAPPTLLCSSPSQVLISILHQALPPVLPMSHQSPIVSSPSSAHKPFLLVWDSMSTPICLPLMLTLSWRCLKSSKLSSTPNTPRRSPAPIRCPPSLHCRTSLAPPPPYPHQLPPPTSPGHGREDRTSPRGATRHASSELPPLHPSPHGRTS